MATFEEIAAGLNRVVNKADETTAALAQAGQLADEAAELLTDVRQGSGHLEEEFNHAVQAWSEVAKGVAELSEIVAAGCQGVESYLRTIQGDASARTPAVPGPSTPEPSTAPTSTAPTPAPTESTWVDQQRA